MREVYHKQSLFMKIRQNIYQDPVLLLRLLGAVIQSFADIKEEELGQDNVFNILQIALKLLKDLTRYMDLLKQPLSAACAALLRSVMGNLQKLVAMDQYKNISFYIASILECRDKPYFSFLSDQVLDEGQQADKKSKTTDEERQLKLKLIKQKQQQALQSILAKQQQFKSSSTDYQEYLEASDKGKAEGQMEIESNALACLYCKQISINDEPQKSPLIILGYCYSSNTRQYFNIRYGLAESSQPPASSSRRRGVLRSCNHQYHLACLGQKAQKKYSVMKSCGLCSHVFNVHIPVITAEISAPLQIQPPADIDLSSLPPVNLLEQANKLAQSSLNAYASDSAQFLPQLANADVLLQFFKELVAAVKPESVHTTPLELLLDVISEQFEFLFVDGVKNYQHHGLQVVRHLTRIAQQLLALMPKNEMAGLVGERLRQIIDFASCKNPQDIVANLRGYQESFCDMSAALAVFACLFAPVLGSRLLRALAQVFLEQIMCVSTEMYKRINDKLPNSSLTADQQLPVFAQTSSFYRLCAGLVLTFAEDIPASTTDKYLQVIDAYQEEMKMTYEILGLTSVTVEAAAS